MGTVAQSQEAMFTLTPPPSEFDEIDKSLLTCSPPFSGFTYPSPAPSLTKNHSSSGTSDSFDLCQEDMSFVDTQPLPSDLFFGDAAHTTLEPLSTLSESEMAHYTTSASSYPLYQQNQWMQYSTYPQQPSINSYEHPSASTYPPFESTISSHYTNIIPPTPQDIAPLPFNFNSLPQPSPHHPQHLSASPSFSHHSSGQTSDLSSSMSRSPSPTIYQMAGNDSSSRPTLRSNSTSSTSSLHAYGIPVADNSLPMSQPAWRCAYPGCTSRATFTRGCDLRKHYNRHSKHLFCRVDGCPQSQAAAASRCSDGTLTGGFSSKKDRARHEAKHNPGIKCEYVGHNGAPCERVFSRTDNMKDHMRRIHFKKESKTS